MFWLGWTKKIKSIFTKAEADKLYIPKSEKNNFVQTSGDQTINGNKTFTGTTGFGRVSTLGSTSNGDAFFLPKKDSGKSILYTGNSAFNNDKRFDIDLQDRTKLLNVPNPTSDKDAANKFYVDTNFVPNSQKSNFVQLSGNQVINGNKSFNGITRFSDKIEAGFGSGSVNITPEDNSNKIMRFSGVSGRGKFDLDMNNVSKIQNLPSPTQNGDAINKQYLELNFYTKNYTDNNFVSKLRDQDISGYKSFNGHLRVVNDFSLGLVNEAPVIGGSNYSFDNGKLKKTDNKAITHKDELVPKSYVDSKTDFSALESRLSKLEQYSKTGILQFQIIDFNQGRVRIKWVQKPLNWNDSNILLNRIHISGQRYDVARDDVWTEFSAGGFQELTNIRLNPTTEFNTNQLNNNIFKDLNLASTIYMWLDWNTQYVESDIQSKIQVPAAFRYEKNGYSWFVPVKIK